MRSLVDAYFRYLEAEPRAPALIVASGAGESLSRSQLHDRVMRHAAAFAGAGVGPGDRVLLLAATTADFVASFWAVQILGATAIPTPGLERGRRSDNRLEQLTTLCALAAPKAIACSPAEAAALCGAGIALALLTPADFAATGVGVTVAAPDAADLAVIQFTSGSTQTPRGCALSHQAVLANALAIRDRTGAEPGDLSVCWLPLHHDMGLMSGIVVPVVSLAVMHLMPPASFLANPLAWLHALSDARPAHTAVPNFALSLALERLQRRGQVTLDLRRVKTILCGAELIDADLVRRFFAALAPHGLAQSAFHAAYGMAETTVMAASLAGGLQTDAVDAAHLDFAQAVRAPGQRRAEIVSLGPAVAGGAFRIADAAGSELPDRHLGRVHLKSPSRMRGYFNDPSATDAVLDGEWLRTGDLGYRMAGRLYVVGRADDVIIVGGQNIHACDVERAVCRALGLDPLRLVAERRPNRLGSHEIVIVLETRQAKDALALKREISQACYAASGFFPADVLLLAPGLIPRTTSGKVKRALLRRQLADGELASCD